MIKKLITISIIRSIICFNTINHQLFANFIIIHCKNLKYPIKLYKTIVRIIILKFL